MSLKAITSYTVLAARRDLFYASTIITLLIVMVLGSVLGQTFVVEQNTTAVVYICAVARFLMVLFATIFTSFHLKRAIDNKEVELFLVRLTPTNLLLKFYFALALVYLVLLMGVGLMFFACKLIGLHSFNSLGLALWLVSLFVETLIVESVALYVVLMRQSAVLAVIITLVFYFLARILGFLLILVNNSNSAAAPLGLDGVCQKALGLIALVLPRLDLVSQTAWVIYGVNDLVSYLWIVIYGVIFICLILSMACYDFNKRQF
jgi:hypothetical protein